MSSAGFIIIKNRVRRNYFKRGLSISQLLILKHISSLHRCPVSRCGLLVDGLRPFVSVHRVHFTHGRHQNLQLVRKLFYIFITSVFLILGGIVKRDCIASSQLVWPRKSDILALKYLGSGTSLDLISAPSCSALQGRRTAIKIAIDFIFK